MGFWKDVYADMQDGIPRDKAVELNIRIRENDESVVRDYAIEEAKQTINKLP